MPPPLDLLSWKFWLEALGFWAKDSENLYRLSLIVAGAIGIPLLVSRTRSANRSARAARKQAKTAADHHDAQTKADRVRRITESFSKAVEQLGSDKLETRLGGIYTLERFSQESEREHWPIMETLTAYVREHAPRPLRPGNPFIESKVSVGHEADPAEDKNAAIRASLPVGPPATDIQAVLTVLGRRRETARKQNEADERRLDLSATDIGGAS